jgi:hypothetical protein
VADITYIPTAEGWLYLAVMMDLFSRRIIGWAMSDQIMAFSGNSKVYSAASLSSSGSGQLRPAACARSTYSFTVLCETRQLRATARWDSFRSWYKRNISRTFRMVNLSWAISTS